MPIKNTLKRKKTRQNSKTRKNNKTRKNKKYGGNFEYVTNLSDIEVNALKKYTQGSDIINKILRIENNYKDLYDTMNEIEIYDINKEIKTQIENINIIDNIMLTKASVAKEDLIVYRGTINTKDDAPYLDINKGYISTSKTINALEKNSYRFLNETNQCCVYIYTIKKGVPYINLSKISYFGEQHQENQEEILLPRGLKSTLTSFDEKTKILGISYKTYNVTIELNEQDKYDIEPIEKSPPIIQMIEVFEIIDNILKISGFFYNLMKNESYNNDEINSINDIYDYDDNDDITEKFVKKILLSSNNLRNLLYEYKEFISNIIEKLMELEFLKDDDKEGLIKTQEEVKNLYEHRYTT